MNRTFVAALAAVSLIALTSCEKQQAAAADPIDGTWKADVASVQFEEKPDVYLLKDGQYNCSSCVPPFTVAADGQFHAVDRPYYDSMAVRTDDDRTVTLMRKKGGRDVGEDKLAVAADGKMMTVEFRDSSTPDAPPVTGKVTLARVAEAPEGAHAISGSWKTAKVDAVSDEGMVFTFDREGDTVNLSTPGGISYSAKLGGPEVPIKGDIAGTMVKVEAVGDNGVRETYSRDGKVTNVSTYTVGADGKMSGVSENKLNGNITRYMANKQ